jgi:succinoglycan biosynthesis transport protein ExoP
MVTSPCVLIPVIEHLGLRATPDHLATSTTTDSPLNTVLIQSPVTDTDPKLASDVANATADGLGTQVTALKSAPARKRPRSASTP